MADGWNIQISSSGMVDPRGFTIAPSAIVYVGPSSSLPAGVTPVSERRPLSQSGTLIATGSSAAVESSGWTITLEFTPPSDTPPGSYSATINIEVVTAGA